jgi:hypothetical protein
MTNKKVSGLTAATALAGTEVLPIVQGGVTVKATVDQVLTPAAGKGVNFTANTPAAGMTSQLLNWYEEGTFTPVFENLTVGNGSVFGFYVRAGRSVTVTFGFTYGSTTTLTGSLGAISGLPFTIKATSTNAYQYASGCIFKPGDGWYDIKSYIQSNTNYMLLTLTAAHANITATVPTTLSPSAALTLSFTYQTT